MSLWRIHHYRLVRLFLVTAVLLALVACRINENNAVGELVSTQPATPPPQTISPTPTSLPTASPTHPPDPTSTPTAELTSTIQPTLTPTASPTLVQATPTLSPELAALRVVFVREQQLWLWQGGTAVALTAADEDTKARLSDDGEMVAFSRQRELWAISADGSDERLLLGVSDLEALGTENSELAVDEFDWVPDSHHLLFNTALITQEVYRPTDDLYSVNVDTSQWRLLLPAGEGGWGFKFSPDGKYVALMTPEQISVANLDGTNRRTLLTYEQMYTYSGGSLYADPVWSPNSDALMVDIRPQDPLGEDAGEPVEIWYLPLQEGEATLVAEVDASPFFHGVYISPDLTRLAFAQTAANDGQPADFYTSQIDGTDRELFYKGVGGFESWHPDSNRFLYWQGEQRDLFLGQVGSREPLFLTDLDIVSVAWIDSEHALYRSGENGNFALHIGVMAEPGVTLLVAEQVSNRWFDFSH